MGGRRAAGSRSGWWSPTRAAAGIPPNPRTESPTPSRPIGRRWEWYRSVPLGSLAPERLVATDLLVIGTWVEGLVLAAVGPAKAAMAAIERLPRLAGMPVGIFCSNFNPGGTLKTLQSVIEARDGQVIETAAFGRLHPVTPRSFAAGCSRSFRSVGPAR